MFELNNSIRQTRRVDKVLIKCRAVQFNPVVQNYLTPYKGTYFLTAMLPT